MSDNQIPFKECSLASTHIKAAKVIRNGNHDGISDWMEFENGHRLYKYTSWFKAHNVCNGGFYIQFLDGHETFLPASTFNKHFATRIGHPLIESTDCCGKRDKVFHLEGKKALRSGPGSWRQRWICRACGAEGKDVYIPKRTKSEYDQVKEKFKK